MDLEEKLRKEDVDLWRDTERLRQDLVEVLKTHRMAVTRSEIISDPDNGHKEDQNTMVSGNLPGS